MLNPISSGNVRVLKTLFAAAFLTAALSPLALAAEKGQACGNGCCAAPAATDADKAPPTGDPYPLATDPVTGEPLGDTPVVLNHEGRELRFTSQDTAKQFQAEPSKYIPAVDKQIADQQRELYPLDVCPISGGKLGSMGEPVEIVHNNRLVRFCCAGCINKFKQDPAPHLKRMDQAAAEQQQDSYPLTTCVVSGEELGSMGETIDRVYNNQLVRFCCPMCEEQFQQNPAKYLEKIRAAGDKEQAASDGHGQKEPKGHKGHDHAGHNH